MTLFARRWLSSSARRRLIRVSSEGSRSSGTQTLLAFGQVIYTCSIDPVVGAGIFGDYIQQAGDSLFNTVMVTATPKDNSGAVTLTDTVTATFS